MFDPSIKVNKAVYAKAKAAAKLLGCSSLREFVEKILEDEADKVLNQQNSRQLGEDEIEKIANKLKGLGYIE